MVPQMVPASRNHDVVVVVVLFFLREKRKLLTGAHLQSLLFVAQSFLENSLTMANSDAVTGSPITPRFRDERETFRAGSRYRRIA